MCGAGRETAVAVQPRGDVETQRALQLLNEGGPIELRGVDLQNQTLEHAATEKATRFSPGREKFWPPRAPRIPRVFRSYPELIVPEVRLVPASSTLQHTISCDCGLDPGHTPAVEVDDLLLAGCPEWMGCTDETD